MTSTPWPPKPRRVHADVLPPVRMPTAPEVGSDLLTPTDRGRLAEPTRRLLVNLLQGPYLAQATHAALWSVLIANEDLVRERLGDLFLDLVFDQEKGVAFVRPMTSDEVALPRPIRSLPLTFVDTVLVLFLRERLLRAQTSRVFVGREEIDEHLALFWSTAGSNAAQIRKRINASVAKLTNNSMLLRADTDDRYEISPVLGLVFDTDQVRAVTAELRRMAADGGAEPRRREDPAAAKVTVS
ncbi:MAG: DUF4194 domain-containing protein [Propioniciclava sp.]